MKVETLQKKEKEKLLKSEKIPLWAVLSSFFFGPVIHSSISMREVGYVVFFESIASTRFTKQQQHCIFNQV